MKLHKAVSKLLDQAPLELLQCMLHVRLTEKSFRFLISYRTVNKRKRSMRR